jgi:hypothetical protein
MMDTATTAQLAALNTTMFAALNARDAAIAYIHSIDVVPPPAPKVRVRAHRSGGVIAASGWSTTMSPVLFDVDDELMQVDGTRTLFNLSPSRTHLLDLVELQGTKASRTLNRYWPPAPPAG